MTIAHFFIARHRHGQLRVVHFEAVILSLDVFAFPIGQPNINHNIESAMWERRMASGDGVLEELTRVYAYDQTPLGEVDKAVKRLEHSKKADDVLSPEFQELWETFRQALKKP